MLIQDHWDKFSMYNRTAQEALNDLRRFADEQGLPRPLFDSRNKHRICVGIASARRKGSPFKYLSQTLAGLVTRMRWHDGVYIHVFNVDDHPEQHTEVDEIRDLFPVSETKARTDVKYERPLQEGLDFAEQLDLMYSWDCPYIIFLEDDALAQEQWVERLNIGLEQLEAEDWLAVRLYTAREWYPPQQEPGITDFDPGFNAVAVLFNRRFLADTSNEHRAAVERSYMTNTEWLYVAKDIFLPVYAREDLDLPMKAFEPSIFQHTGIFSSVRTRDTVRMEWYMQAMNWESENRPIVFDPQWWMSRGPLNKTTDEL